MKIAYSFQDGQSCEIDVSAEFGELLLELDRQERNNERKETRRHTSLYSFDYEGEIFDSHEDVAGTVERDMELAALDRKSVV